MKSATRLLKGLIGLTVLCASISVWTAAAAAPAKGVVQNLDDTLIATMKQADTLGFEGRYKKLAPVIDDAFDLDRIARLALGSSWGKLNAAQRTQYQAMFRKDTIATYASRFKSFSGQSFEIKSAGDAPGGRAQVNTVIHADGKTIPINYVLDQSSGEWKIVNVVAKGVSDQAHKRGQYTSSIRENGPECFLDQYQKQLAKYPSIPNVAVADGSETSTRPSAALEAKSGSGEAPASDSVLNKTGDADES